MTKKIKLQLVTAASLLVMLVFYFNACTLNVNKTTNADVNETTDAKDVSFFFVGDIHLGKEISDHDENDSDHDHTDAEQIINASDVYNWNSALISTVNRSINDASFRDQLITVGINPNVKGLIVSGDLTDNGQQWEWDQFETLYGGPNIASYPMKLPLFESIGNHDYPWRNINEKYTSPEQLYSIKRMQSRNQWRKNSFSNNIIATHPAGHYAMKWDNVVLVQLGVKVSNSIEELIERKSDPGSFRHIHPFDSYDFLKTVLYSDAVDKNSKIILNYHYPIFIGRYTQLERENLFELLKKASTDGRGQVVTMLNAHRHRTSVSHWCGIPIFEAGSPLQLAHGEDVDAAFAAINISPETLTVTSVGWSLDGQIKLNPESCVLGKENNNKCFRYSKRHADIQLNLACTEFLDPH